eukprot:TRINITY_DN1391_c0_g1_i1.p3 TRINITY_DN1391_c0_g1~~TRINITY_DN1391_c0_g1_i1.p3  ORF type:complete len:212 (+),score=29.94 TRINITY_DN1391_c0_g1_i1:31-666(+)
MAPQISTILAAALALTATAAEQQAPKPTWGPTFFARFDESLGKEGQPHPNFTTVGYYALDLTFKGGSQTIYRRDGTGDASCGAYHPNEPCLQVATQGNRYLVWPRLDNKCCICCSFAEGCGPIGSQWVSNATFRGVERVGGSQCNAWTIQGFQTNWLKQRVGSNVICEVTSGSHDNMTFVQNTWNTEVDPSHFDIPPNCNQRCGNAGECSA